MSKVLTGVQHIYLTPWVETNGTYAPSSVSGDRIELTCIIADSVAITQEDHETTSHESETSDSPIIESVKLGKYTVSMDSADIDFPILEKCLGFSLVTKDSATVGACAPATYQKKHALIEVVMSDATLVVPKALLASKIDASSLKTNVCKGTISGTGFDANIAIDSANAVKTPFAVVASGKTFVVTDAS